MIWLIQLFDYFVRFCWLKINFCVKSELLDIHMLYLLTFDYNWFPSCSLIPCQKKSSLRIGLMNKLNYSIKKKLNINERNHKTLWVPNVWFELIFIPIYFKLSYSPNLHCQSFTIDLRYYTVLMYTVLNTSVVLKDIGLLTWIHIQS